MMELVAGKQWPLNPVDMMRTSYNANCSTHKIYSSTHMESQHIQNRLDALERRTKQLTKWLGLALCGWIVTMSLLLLSWTLPTRHYPNVVQTDSLRVKQIAIVDPEGHERIVLGSPLPDGMMNGKVAKRRSVATGIQFKDPNGNERGGMVTLSDGSFVIGIDDEQVQERAHIFYIPKRGSGILLQGRKGSKTVSLLVPDTSATQLPVLEMTGPTGKKIVSIPAQKK